MIGFFGGSFDPIHFGHLNLAHELMKNGELEEVWFCPAFISPFKLKGSLVSPSDRLHMIELAIKGVPQFKVIDEEIKRGGPSYTIDTIKELTRDTGRSFRLLLGEDQWDDFSKWKESEQLLDLAPPLIGGRVLDISSTEIRERLKKGGWIDDLVPKEVSEYIYNKGLYLNG